MSRLRILLAAVLAVSALAVMAVPASASMPAASNAKFCAAAAKIGDSAGTTPNASELKGVAADFKSAAKSAPPKVKKAMLNVASLLNALGTKDASDLAQAYTDSGFVKNYTKSVTTYATYYAQTCSG